MRLHIKIIHGVNIDSISEDIFFTNILEIIKSYCDNVKIVEPDSTQANLLKTYNVLALTNTKERSILSYTTMLTPLSTTFFSFPSTSI